MSDEEQELVKRISVMTLMVSVEFDPHVYFETELRPEQAQRMSAFTGWRDACIAQWAAETEAVGDEYVPLVTKLNLGPGTRSCRWTFGRRGVGCSLGYMVRAWSNCRVG